MKNTYLLKLTISLIPILSITLLLLYICFDLNSKVGGLGFVLFSVCDLYENYLLFKSKNSLNTFNIIINLIIFILGMQMILNPLIF